MVFRAEAAVITSAVSECCAGDSPAGRQRSRTPQPPDVKMGSNKKRQIFQKKNLPLFYCIALEELED